MMQLKALTYSFFTGTQRIYAARLIDYDIITYAETKEIAKNLLYQQINDLGFYLTDLGSPKDFEFFEIEL
jgi:hypothetical protein